jgi:hypothetical protein
MGIITFNSVFDKRVNKFSLIKLSETDIHNCVYYIRGVVKKNHGTTKLPQKNEKYKDMFKSVCAITAVSKQINHPIVDYRDFNTEPIIQLRNTFSDWVDVIVFNYGEFPIFYRPMYKKAIFVCKVNETEFMVCGYCNATIINSFHSKMLVQNQTIREQSVMSAFYGFEHLKPIPNNVYDFKNLFKN